MWDAGGLLLHNGVRGVQLLLAICAVITAVGPRCLPLQPTEKYHTKCSHSIPSLHFVLKAVPPLRSGADPSPSPNEPTKMTFLIYKYLFLVLGQHQLLNILVERQSSNTRKEKSIVTFHKIPNCAPGFKLVMCTLISSKSLRLNMFITKVSAIQLMTDPHFWQLNGPDLVCF